MPCCPFVPTNRFFSNSLQSIYTIGLSKNTSKVSPIQIDALLFRGKQLEFKRNWSSRLSAGVKIHDFQKQFWKTAIAGYIYQCLFSLDKHFVLFVYALTQNHVATPTIVKYFVESNSIENTTV